VRKHSRKAVLRNLFVQISRRQTVAGCLGLSISNPEKENYEQ
jgi:hypothetical protein